MQDIKLKIITHYEAEWPEFGGAPVLVVVLIILSLIRRFWMI